MSLLGEHLDFARKGYNFLWHMVFFEEVGGFLLPNSENDGAGSRGR